MLQDFGHALPPSQHPRYRPPPCVILSGVEGPRLAHITFAESSTLMCHPEPAGEGSRPSLAPTEPFGTPRRASHRPTNHVISSVIGRVRLMPSRVVRCRHHSVVVGRRDLSTALEMTRLVGRQSGDRLPAKRRTRPLDVSQNATCGWQKQRRRQPTLPTHPPRTCWHSWHPWHTYQRAMSPHRTSGAPRVRDHPIFCLAPEQE